MMNQQVIYLLMFWVLVFFPSCLPFMNTAEATAEEESLLHSQEKCRRPISSPLVGIRSEKPLVFEHTWENKYLGQRYKDCLQSLTYERLPYLRQQAESGDPFAQCMLGMIYARGVKKGMSRSEKEAVKWYERAAERGDAEAQYQIGVIYQYDDVGTKKGVTGFFYYEQAARQGHLMAQYNLGVQYTRGVFLCKRGELLPRDRSRAIHWLTAAAEMGLNLAQYKLGLLYTGKYNKEEEKERDMGAARHWFEKARDQGHTESVLELAKLGEAEEAGLTLQNAVTIYEKIIADDQMRREFSGCLWAATYRLSDIYYDGKGGKITPNPERAIVFLRVICRSVLEGYGIDWFRDFDSLYKLGDLLVVKEGVDLAQGFRCLKMVCDHAPDTTPFPDLEFRVGRMYEEGRGTKQDDGQAAHYYKLALRKGNAEAGERLARLHAQGRGLTTLERLRGKPSTSPSSCAIV